MAKGFVNLNRFKHGKAIKQNNKQKANLQSNKKVRGRVPKLSLERNEESQSALLRSR